MAALTLSQSKEWKIPIAESYGSSGNDVFTRIPPILNYEFCILNYDIVYSILALVRA